MSLLSGTISRKTSINLNDGCITLTDGSGSISHEAFGMDGDDHRRRRAVRFLGNVLTWQPSTTSSVCVCVYVHGLLMAN